jgi:hypothetical protein
MDAPDLPPDLFQALVDALATLVLKDIEVAENDELPLPQDESNQPVNHQPVTRRDACA